MTRLRRSRLSGKSDGPSIRSSRCRTRRTSRSCEANMSVIALAGGPFVSQAANGGKVYGFSTIGNVSPVTVLSSNGQRRRVVFHNPGANDVLVYPTTTGTGAVNAPTIASPGGGFRIFGNGGMLTIEGECQQAWAALHFTTTGQPLTVMESNA